ncbi:hypothetical protein Clacol_000546 [Clathrus columnatus]|uniref:DNA ligase n=1 Tax=Clathrus columnatus TaxID=1419009 RepID=A0AAV5A390_9AGAM|nr:hypothetical protein Clacol_000546 [Clathrus columnatus]
MPPKRSASTASPGKKTRTSPTKKIKLSSGQSSLDQYFVASGSTDGKTKSISNNTLSLQEEENTLELDSLLADSDLDEPDNYPNISKSQLTKDEGPNNGSSFELSIGVTSQKNYSENYHPDLVIDPLDFTIDNSTQSSSASAGSYSFLVHALTTLSNTRSRIAIINTLTNYFRCVISHHPSSLIPSLYLLTNSLGPSYLAVELGLGPSIITKAIQQVSGLSPAALSKLYKSLGDPGDVAFAAKSSIRTLIPHPPLSTIHVYETMLNIAHTQGQGSVKLKQKLVEKLLLSAKGEESRYLVRTLCQNLRVGAVRNSIISALARAMVFIKPNHCDVDDVPESSSSALYITTPRVLNKVHHNGNGITRSDKGKGKGKEEIVQLYLRAEGILKHAFVIHPNLDDIAEALLDGGLGDIPNRITLSVGIPLHPTLGSPARSLDEIYERLQDQAFAAELKYDGQRAQIHAFSEEDGKKVFVKVFSRHLEDMTEKYPDVVALVQRLISRSLTTSQLELKSFIIDSEIVAVNPDTGDLRSFQDLSQRARKDVCVEDIKVSVGVYAYDIMYLNGEILIGSPFRQRRNLLYEYLPNLIPETKTIARFCHAQKCDSEEGQEAIEEFWATAVNGRAEGLMIKLLDHGEVNVDDGAPTKTSSSSNNKSRRKPLPASYEPDKRTLAWIKLKKDYVEGLGDSLDMVPIGAWHGNGRKAAWWSPVLLAVWDPSQEEFVAVCKCMSGFSDAFYKEMKGKYVEDSEYCSITSKWNSNVGGEPSTTRGFSPSVYFKPSEVWEIRGADITLSPVSVASRELVGRDKGLSLRFPRFMRSKLHLQHFWRICGVNKRNEGEGEGGGGGGVDEGDLVEPDWNSADEEEEMISLDADEDRDGDDTLWASFWGLIYRKFFWDFVSGTLRFPGGLQPAASDKIFIDIIVKAPIIQILSILVALSALALELGLPPPLKKTMLYRSWIVRIVILIVQAFFTILFYQGTNAALYSFVAVIGYTMAQIRGESIAEAHSNKGSEGKA